jgi:NTE family protein
MSVRALVLGGGGATGLAWEVGILAGLAHAGVDLGSADAVIGTSAGALLGAQLRTGAQLEELYRAQLTEAEPARAVASLSVLLRLSWLLLRHRDPHRYRIEVGRFAATAPTQSAAQWHAELASRLPTSTWPERRLVIAAVDAGTGERVAFDGADGAAGAGDPRASLVDAVAASTAAPGFRPSATIDGRTFIDGGVASAANVDLAAGYQRIVVVAPIDRGSGPIPSVSQQVARLPAGSRVAVVVPDRSARRAMGWNPMNSARRPDAARAGRDQADAVVAMVRRVWTGEEGAASADAPTGLA